jgi:outer membrane protein
MLMKQIRIILAALLFTTAIPALQAQKFAYVDTDYILENIPAYTQAQAKLDAEAVKWQKEIDAKFKEVEVLYAKFQAEQFLFTEEMKNQKREEYENLELEAQELQRQRFGFEGDLFKRRAELIQPIQDKIFDAIEKLAQTRAYDFIFDKASAGASMLYTDPKHDMSDIILKNLGYK